MGSSSSSTIANKPKANTKATDIPSIDVAHLLVFGYLRQNLETMFAKSLESQVPGILTMCADYYRMRDLVIDKEGYTELYCTKHISPHIFDSIHIKEKGRLTVNAWNSETQSGGTLYLICKGDIILDKKACITVDGKGYPGGHGSNMSGESYQSKSKHGNGANLGGGGGGNGYAGGGGGYATNGVKGKLVNDNPMGQNPVTTTATSWFVYDKHPGEGGKTYGDKELSILHLGSGGGSVMNNHGGAGGGALMIKCFGSIRMKHRALISANGDNGKGTKSGCGSGGSIHIILKELDSLLDIGDYASIQAMGEKNYSGGNSGDGGIGRIRVQLMETQRQQKEMRAHFSRFDALFKPGPYFG